MMALPPTLNYCFASYQWWSNKKISRKKWIWIFVLFNLYHQINAISVLKSFRKKDNLDAKKKQKTLSKVSFLEPYLESAPTGIILSMIWCSALTGNGIETFGYMAQDYNAGYFDCKNVSDSWTKWEANDDRWPSPRKQIHVENFCTVFQGPGGLPWFFITFGISIFSSSLGITKFLQNGPCAILPNSGLLGGLLNSEFILVFISVMFAIVAKGVFALLMTGAAFGDNYSVMISGLIFLGVNILPHILCAIIWISWSTGFNRKLYKLVLDYPALVLLPAFTYYSVGSKKLPRFSQEKSWSIGSHIILSRKWTIVNVFMTVVLYGCAISLLLFAYPTNLTKTWIVLAGHRLDVGYEAWFKIGFAPLMIVSLFPALAFLSLHVPCCHSSPRNCCCSSCCSSNCLKFKEDYIDTNEYGK